MWEGLGSSLIASVITVALVGLTLRHERRLQDSGAVEAELRRLLDALRASRDNLLSAMVRHMGVIGIVTWTVEAKRTLPAIQREYGVGLRHLYAGLLGDLDGAGLKQSSELADDEEGLRRALRSLEALLTWTVLSPEVLTKARIVELQNLRAVGKSFD